MSNLVPSFIQNYLDEKSGYKQEVEEAQLEQNIKNKSKLINKSTTLKENKMESNKTELPNTSSNKTRLPRTSSLNTFSSSLSSLGSSSSSNIGNQNNNNQEPTTVEDLVKVVKNSNLTPNKKLGLMKVLKENVEHMPRRDDSQIHRITEQYDSIPKYSMPVYPPQQMPYMPPYQIPPYNPYYPYQQMPYMPHMQHMMPQYQQNMPNEQLMLLDRKINTLQLELGDLFRHMKEYTRRYMDSVRQGDMDIIQEYIKELTDVKGTVKEAKEIASTAQTEEDED
jgi:hypothetical protein